MEKFLYIVPSIFQQLFLLLTNYFLILDFSFPTTTVKNFSFRVWEARVKVSQDSREPGTIVSGKKTLDIMTGKDILSITKLQLPGKKMISVKDFLNGYANLIED